VSSSSSVKVKTGRQCDNYPCTDDDKLTNPKLNTWIDEEEFKTLLIAPEYPKDRCVIPNAPSGYAGANRAIGAAKP